MCQSGSAILPASGGNSKYEVHQLSSNDDGYKVVKAKIVAMVLAHQEDDRKKVRKYLCTMRPGG
jgi:hypothetical protein